MRAPTPLRFLLSSLIILVCATACAGNKPTQTQTPAAEAPRFNRVERMEFNRRAAALFLPVFWRADDDNDGDLDPSELAVLWGVSNEPATTWIANGSFTPAFVAGYGTIEKGVSTAGLLADEKARRDLVLQELGQGRPTLILTDLAKGSPEDKAIVTHILTAARWIERIYAKQNGVWGLAEKMAADDTASKALYFRNQGPFCEAPKTEKDPACNALADKPKKLSGIYPDEIQADPKFCEALEKRKEDEKALLSPFVVVRYPETVDAKIKKEGKAATDTLVPVPYTVAYAEEMKAISDELRSAAAAVVDPQESAFKAYLEAAAGSFVSNDWVPADTAWAAMNATNSKWYLRIGPDEVYFEPCSRKAGFHVSFARINQDSLAWQKKLDPLKKELEAEAAGLAGPPYKARDVGFHLPDFIDIVVNAGDSRNAHGATIGQSLPNWGPVAEKGGRTVAMTNLYTDKDSQAALLEQTASLFCKATMDQVDPDPKHGTMSTVLHEAAHNLGPAHEYKVKGKTDDQVFGGPLASTLEELKSQTAALYFAEWLVEKKVLEDKDAKAAHLRDVTWAFGHISQGMVNAEGKPKPYSQLAAIQMGSLWKGQALVWKPGETAGNGTDLGCFEVDLAKWQPVVKELAKTVFSIKGRGDKRGAEALRDLYVSDKTQEWSKLRGVIQERWLRSPKASFVYAITP